jgi:hypothetical protein
MALIEAVITPTVSTVQVTSAAGAAGQALSSTPSSSIALANNDVGQNSLEYKVGAGAWQTLSSGQGVSLPIDLSATAVLVRKGTSTTASVPLTLTVNAIAQMTPSGVPAVIVGSAAPSNADGRPDGTIYIQTA